MAPTLPESQEGNFSPLQVGATGGPEARDLYPRIGASPRTSPAASRRTTAESAGLPYPTYEPLRASLPRGAAQPDAGYNIPSSLDPGASGSLYNTGRPSVGSHPLGASQALAGTQRRPSEPSAVAYPRFTGDTALPAVAPPTGTTKRPTGDILAGASPGGASMRQVAPSEDGGARTSRRGSRASSVDGSPENYSMARAFNNPDLEAGQKPAANPDSWPTSNSNGMLGYRYHRRTHINWLGWGLYLFYIGALIYYLVIRITKTLDLGPSFVGYGIAILVVECIGATTILQYGINLLLVPVQEEFTDNPRYPGTPQVSLPYHVRVMIPCYKEDLPMVQRTVAAVLQAELPEGCQKTVYLCDDGKDPEKRKWMRSLGPEAVYVSGRKRPKGEMNGKSGNLNNCASQLYPKGVPVPGNELIAVFDADQIARPEFFLRTLPLFDGGDDIGMVLSPQCFHNLNLHCDIFNHSNIHFWEYMQPGYDALGFISCTGTNFLMRAKAFVEAGMSPTYTLTEDFALGMELKKWGWCCRYVQEYLAMGEAPDEIRNCFQQRSRWTKGHFQIIFNPRKCPLFQPRLRTFDKLMYCSGVWSYCVGAITTPVFIAIPLLTIWIGVFPVVISRPFALALTIYAIATQFLLYYVRSPRHVESLWFANIANQLLWWAYVKAAWRSLQARLCCCCAAIAFKATAKGKGRLANSAFGDIWLHVLFFILLLGSIAIGIWQLISGSAIISPLLISILWAAYAMVAPMLITAYAMVGGPGIAMHILCRFAFLLSFGASAAAVGLMWAIPYYNSKNFSGGLISNKDAGVLFRYINGGSGGG